MSNFPDSVPYEEGVRIRCGTRYEKVHTYPTQWGPGKVHLHFYSRAEKRWMRDCDWNNWSLRGYRLPWEGTEVNCKKCLPHANSIKTEKEKEV